MPLDRDIFRRIFRAPTRREHPFEKYAPADPHCLWSFIVPAPESECLPPSCVADELPRSVTGRVVTVPSFGAAEAVTYLMASLRNNITRLPPHPGRRPPELDEFGHPWYITTDGSLGPFDPTRYAQNFRSQTPWIGFHSFPQLDTAPGVNRLSFFDWSGVQESDFSGGRWKLKEIERLLGERAVAEQRLWEAMCKFGDPKGDYLHTHYGPSLPFFDTLTLEAASVWKRWDEGRDAIGSTSRYIAELNAIRRWLSELRRQARNPERVEANDFYAGVWVGGVSSLEEWIFLWRSPLPLYGLYILPPTHPLRLQAQTGFLDNDEYYRMDSFLTTINQYVLRKQPPIPTPYEANYDYGSFHGLRNFADTPSAPTGTILPISLQVLDPTPLVANRPYEDRHSYVTYLYMDTNIVRNRMQLPTPALKNVHKRVLRLTCATARPFRIRHSSLPGDLRMPFHPIVHVLPRRTEFDGNKLRVFVEEEQDGYHWPVLLARSARRNNKDYEQGYDFSHPIGVNDKLLSTYDWPLVNELDRVHFRDDEEEDLEHFARHAPEDGKRAYITLAQSKKIDSLPKRSFVVLPPPALSGSQAPERTGRILHDLEEDDEDDIPMIRIEPSTGTHRANSAANVSNHARDQEPPSEPSLPPATFSMTLYLSDCGVAPRSIFTLSPPTTSTNRPRRDRSRSPSRRNSGPSSLQPAKLVGAGTGDTVVPSAVSKSSRGDKEMSGVLSTGPTEIMQVDHLMDSTTAIDCGVGGLEEHVSTSTNDTMDTSEDMSAPAAQDGSDLGHPSNEEADPTAPAVPPSPQPAIPAPSSSAPSLAIIANAPSSAATPPAPPEPAPTTLTVFQPSMDISLQQCVDRVLRQRLRGQAYMDHRLNRSVVPAQYAQPPLITRCVLDIGSTLGCYPIRISNAGFDGSPQLVLRAMLHMAQRESWGEILIAAVHVELDGTISIDLGFRHLEHAIIMWSRNGKNDRGRYWHIAPTTAVVHKKCIINKSPGSNLPPLETRLQTLTLCEALEQRLCAGRPQSPLLTQLRIILAELSVPSSAPSVSASFSPGTLLSEWAAHYLDGHDHIDHGTDPIGFDTDWFFGVRCEGSNWSPKPLSPPWNGVYRYTSLPFSPPSNLPTARSLAHKKRREKTAAMAPPDESNPGTSRRMVASERAHAERATRHQAQLRYETWNSDALSLPPVPLKPPGQNTSLVDRLLPIWRWYDQCEQVIRDYLVTSGLSVVPSDSKDLVASTRLSSLLAAQSAFGTHNRLRRVFGPEFADIMEVVNADSVAPVDDAQDDLQSVSQGTVDEFDVVGSVSGDSEVASLINSETWSEVDGPPASVSSSTVEVEWPPASDTSSFTDVDMDNL